MIPSTSEERYIYYSEVKQFCKTFSEINSFKTIKYKKLFNKSYLLPIAKVFEPSSVEYSLPEEVDGTLTYAEGAVKKITINAYERNAKARKECINHHGTSCVVCSFDFGEIYGEFADGFIHVYHIEPISNLKGETEIDAIRDLRPVCPNCHAVIHLRGGCLSITETKGLFKNST